MVTIGIEFKIKTVKVDDKIIKALIFDLNGSERFWFNISSYSENQFKISFLLFFMNEIIWCTIKDFLG